MLWPLEVLECFPRGEYLGVGLTVFLFTHITAAPVRDLTGWGTDAAEETTVPDRKTELIVLAVFWTFLVLYILLSAGRSVSEWPRIQGLAMGFAAVVPVSQLALTLIYWQAYLHWPFWLFLLAPAAFNTLSKLPHGIRRPWAGVLLPFAGVLVAGVENMLAPMNGVANADASAMLGWGTRQSADDREAMLKMEVEEIRSERRLRRNVLLAGWLTANISLGVLPLVLHIERVVLKCLLAFVAAQLTVYLVLANCYSLWLYFVTRKADSYPAVQDPDLDCESCGMHQELIASKVSDARAIKHAIPARALSC